MNKTEITITKPNKKYAKYIYELVQESKLLDVNSEYLYLLLCEHFSGTCSIAVCKEKVIGFVSAYILPEQKNTLFIWQMAVDDEFRGNDLARKLILNIIKREENINIEYINTTISPNNVASQNVFKKLKKSLYTEITSEFFFQLTDFKQEHNKEVLYKIGPFKLRKKQ